MTTTTPSDVSADEFFPVGGGGSRSSAKWKVKPSSLPYTEDFSRFATYRPPRQQARRMPLPVTTEDFYKSKQQRIIQPRLAPVALSRQSSHRVQTDYYSRPSFPAPVSATGRSSGNVNRAAGFNMLQHSVSQLPPQRRSLRRQEMPPPPFSNKVRNTTPRRRHKELMTPSEEENAAAAAEGREENLNFAAYHHSLLLQPQTSAPHHHYLWDQPMSGGGGGAVNNSSSPPPPVPIWCRSSSAGAMGGSGVKTPRRMMSSRGINESSRSPGDWSTESDNMDDDLLDEEEEENHLRESGIEMRDGTRCDGMEDEDDRTSTLSNSPSPGKCADNGEELILNLSSGGVVDGHGLSSSSFSQQRYFTFAGSAGNPVNSSKLTIVFEPTFWLNGACSDSKFFKELRESYMAAFPPGENNDATLRAAARELESCAAECGHGLLEVERNLHRLIVSPSAAPPLPLHVRTGSAVPLPVPYGDMEENGPSFYALVHKHAQYLSVPYLSDCYDSLADPCDFMEAWYFLVRSAAIALLSCANTFHHLSVNEHASPATATVVASLCCREFAHFAYITFKQNDQPAKGIVVFPLTPKLYWDVPAHRQQILTVSLSIAAWIRCSY